MEYTYIHIENHVAPDLFERKSRYIELRQIKCRVITFDCANIVKLTFVSIKNLPLSILFYFCEIKMVCSCNAIYIYVCV